MKALHMKILDDVFTPADVTGEAETKLVELIDNFLEQAGDLLDKYAMTEEASLVMTSSSLPTVMALVSGTVALESWALAH